MVHALKTIEESIRGIFTWNGNFETTVRAFSIMFAGRISYQERVENPVGWQFRIDLTGTRFLASKVDSKYQLSFDAMLCWALAEDA
jgi:hypothetical protein